MATRAMQVIVAFWCLEAIQFSSYDRATIKALLYGLNTAKGFYL
jgi:hypothetical protein